MYAGIIPLLPPPSIDKTNLVCDFQRDRSENDKESEIDKADFLGGSGSTVNVANDVANDKANLLGGSEAIANLANDKANLLGGSETSTGKVSSPNCSAASIKDSVAKPPKRPGTEISTSGSAPGTGDPDFKRGLAGFDAKDLSGFVSGSSTASFGVAEESDSKILPDSDSVADLSEDNRLLTESSIPSSDNANASEKSAHIKLTEKPRTIFRYLIIVSPF
jgi:hypothetical protein